MLEKLKKIKSSVRYYMADYEIDRNSNITLEEWELVNDIILLIAPFFNKEV